jgi:hypothetical protein
VFTEEVRSSLPPLRSDCIVVALLSVSSFA